MKMKLTEIITTFLLVTFGVTFAENSISFFNNYSSIAVHNSTLVAACEELPYMAAQKSKYVTTEACVELHSSKYCDERRPFLPLNSTASKFDLGTFGKRVEAFKPCHLAPSLYQDKRMRIYGYYGLLHDLPIEFNDKNCAIFPTSLRKEENTLEADICLILFDEENCEGSRVRMEKPSIGIFDLAVKSYSICDKDEFLIVPDRKTVHAKVIRAVFTVADNAMEVATKKALTVEGTLLFENNGSVPVKQIHKFSKSIEEVLEMELLNSLLSFDVISTASEATFTSPNDIPTFAMNKLRQSFKMAYSGRTAEPKFRDVTNRDYSIEQTFEIPSCSSYEVTSVVNSVKNYAVDYNVTVEVTGEWGTGRNLTDMTSEELKEKVNEIQGITYNFNKVVGGKNVAVAWALGNLTLSFGQGIDVKGVGAPVPNCIKY